MGAVRYIRLNPAVTLGLALAVIVLSQIFQVLAQIAVGSLSPQASTRAVVATFAIVLGSSAIGVVVTLVAFAVLSGLLIVVLSRAVLGRRTELGEAWAAVRRRVPGLVGLSLLPGLIIAAIVLIAVVPIIVVAVATDGGTAAVVLAVVLVPVAFLVAVYVAVSLVLATPAYVLENIGVVAALTRSRALVRGAWWRTFGILLLAGIIAALVGGVIGGVVSAIVGFPLNVSGFDATPTAAELVPAAIGSIIAGTFTLPFGTGLLGLLYIDRRIRKERFDVDLARSAPGLANP